MNVERSASYAERAVSVPSIIGNPPHDIGELESAIGISLVDADVAGNDFGHFMLRRELSGQIADVSASYVWDMYHEHPASTLDRLRTRRLLDFTVSVRDGRAAIERELVARFGEPRVVDSAYVYDHWIVRRHLDDACALSHHETLPDWAVEQPTQEARERFLINLMAAAAATGSLDELDGIVSSAPAAAGVRVGSVSRKSVSLTLVPPISALELVRLLGWGECVGQSGDVHQSNWELHRVVQSGTGGWVTQPPSCGAWSVRAAVDGRPSGGEIEEPNPPLGGRHRLATKDVVRYLSLGKR
jgi:hypothetical protein